MGVVWERSGNFATHTHRSFVSMYCRSNQDASQRGRCGLLVATIAHRMAQWGVYTITKRSEEGSVETTWFKVKKKGGFTNDLHTS